MQNHVKFSELTPDSLELDFLKENAVIVRIWTGKNINTPTGDNVGHVSLELRKLKRYISLWPRQMTHSHNLQLVGMKIPINSITDQVISNYL